MLLRAMTLMVALSLSAAGLATADPTWNIQSTPLTPLSESSALGAVSCANTITCVAFGTAEGEGSPIDFAEVFSAGSWTNQPINDFNSNGVDAYGIDCPAANVCYAVGDAQYAEPDIPSPSPELLRLDGGNWDTLNVPGIGNNSAGLHGISCGSETGCLAVGEVGDKPLVESLRGARWRRIAAPKLRHAVLYDVSCSGLRLCMVVGSIRNNARLGLAEFWNGPHWKRERTPKVAHAHGGVLVDVSCTAPNACVAVGSYKGSAGSRPLAERWNGRRWRLLRTASDAQGPSTDNGDYFSSVSCTAANACEAVGYDLPHNDALAEAWDGTRWRWQALPTGSYSLSGVSCVTSAVGSSPSFQCTAVGSQGSGPFVMTSVSAQTAARMDQATSRRGRASRRRVAASASP